MGIIFEKTANVSDNVGTPIALESCPLPYVRKGLFLIQCLIELK